jgi:hypothetical protein
MEVNRHKDSTRLNPHDYINLEMKKGNSNMYSTRILVNLSLVAYIKSGKGAPRGASDRIYNILDRHNSVVIIY